MYLYCFSSNTRLSILSFSPSPAFLVFIAESCYRFRICHQHLGSADNYSVPQQKHVHPHMQQYVKCTTCTNRLIYIVHTREVVFFCVCPLSILYLHLWGNDLVPNKATFTKVGRVVAEVEFMPSRWHTAILLAFYHKIELTFLPVLLKKVQFLQPQLVEVHT